ncbi:VOC family protein [Amycolatopsis pithecellobii]|nr:VOC family protein [Amycolatopsis pithecellobii]
MLFHTGMIVPDLDAAMKTMAAGFGFAWADPITTTGQMRNPTSVGQRTTRLTFSTNGPHRVELLEHIDGEMWRTAEHPVHHLGFAVPDLEDACRHLEAKDYVPAFELHGPDDGAPIAYYFRSPVGGLWIETVSYAVYQDLMKWVDSGLAPDVAKPGAGNVR